MATGLIHWVSLLGAAIAFTVFYFAYTAGMLAIARRTLSFAWSRSVLTQLAWMAPLAFAIFTLDLFLDGSIATFIGLIATLGAGLACLRKLSAIAGLDNCFFRVAKSTMRTLSPTRWR